MLNGLENSKRDKGSVFSVPLPLFYFLADYVHSIIISSNIRYIMKSVNNTLGGKKVYKTKTLKVVTVFLVLVFILSGSYFYFKISMGLF